MSVSLTNEVRHYRDIMKACNETDRLQGPVTFTLDSRKFEYIDGGKGNSNVTKQKGVEVRR